jgi:hypothetical protein
MSTSILENKVNCNNKIISILRYLEDKFYNIDSGILQYPDMCNFAISLERSISEITELLDCVNYTNSDEKYCNSDDVNNIDFIDSLQLSTLENNKNKTQ